MSSLCPRLRQSVVALAVLLAVSGPLQAGPITDPVGDFLPTFAGIKGPDLDVVSANFLLDGDTFVLTARMAGPIGITPSAIYVWGINRGAGTAGFAQLGLNGILFDRVVVVRPNGGANAFPFTVAGDVLTVRVPAINLPSTGFQLTQYTANLWPRDSAVPAGDPQISDFAPDNSNILVEVIPEPTSLLLCGTGVLFLFGLRRRRVRKM